MRDWAVEFEVDWFADVDLNALHDWRPIEADYEYQRGPRMRIIDRVAALIEKSIATHAPDEDVDFEVWVGTIPTSPSQMAPALHMIMQVPSPILGEKIMTFTLSQGSLTPGEVEVDRWVTETLGALRDKRAELLAEANGKPLPKRATWDDKEGLPWNRVIPE